MLEQRKMNIDPEANKTVVSPNAFSLLLLTRLFTQNCPRVASLFIVYFAVSKSSCFNINVDYWWNLDIALWPNHFKEMSLSDLKIRDKHHFNKEAYFKIASYFIHISIFNIILNWFGEIVVGTYDRLFWTLIYFYFRKWCLQN